MSAYNTVVFRDTVVCEAPHERTKKRENRTTAQSTLVVARHADKNTRIFCMWPLKVLKNTDGVEKYEAHSVRATKKLQPKEWQLLRGTACHSRP